MISGALEIVGICIVAILIASLAILLDPNTILYLDLRRVLKEIRTAKEEGETKIFTCLRRPEMHNVARLRAAGYSVTYIGLQKGGPKFKISWVTK